MKNIGRFLWPGALSLLCGVALAGNAGAATCHEAVAGATYKCAFGAPAPGSGDAFALRFDATGDNAFARNTPLRCFCSSTGTRAETLKLEAGLGLVCLSPEEGDDVGIFLSGRVAGKKITQGTAVNLDGASRQTFFYSCDRLP